MSNRPFGFELLVDAYKCPEDCCDNLDIAYDFLDQIVHVLKLHRLAPPFLFRVAPCSAHDPGGLTGWIPLSESGVQLHTVPEKGFVSVDVYGCRLFNVQVVRHFVQKAFHPKQMETYCLDRGVHYAARNLRSTRSRRHRPCGG